MRRATITLPDDLEAEVEEYLAKQEAPPSLTSLIQAALRRFLDAPSWERTGPAGGRLEDLPALLASLPRLSESEAEELAADLDRAREELARKELIDPWSRPAPGGGSATGSA
jgi:Arc/MetJ-type ribon-helix-helix transcriptional regulator